MQLSVGFGKKKYTLNLHLTSRSSFTANVYSPLAEDDRHSLNPLPATEGPARSLRRVLEFPKQHARLPKKRGLDEDHIRNCDCFQDRQRELPVWLPDGNQQRDEPEFVYGSDRNRLLTSAQRYTGL